MRWTRLLLGLFALSCAAPVVPSPSQAPLLPTPLASSSAAATATTSPSPTPSAAIWPSAPGKSVRLSDEPLPAAGSYLLVQIPGENHLRGVSWDGSSSGLLSAELPASAAWLQSPDGARYWIERTVYDRAGHALGTAPWPYKGSLFTWAANGDVLCQAVPETWVTGSKLRLETARLGAAPRLIASGYGIWHDNAGYPVLACDPKADRAIVGAFGQGLFGGHYWVFRLSTGALIRSVDVGEGAVGAWIVASDDGTLVAESVQEVAGANTTTIRRADDGAVLAMWPDFEAHGFSGDGSLVFGWFGMSKIALVEWRTGRVVWSASGPYPYVGFRAEPNGKRVAIAISPKATIEWEQVYLVGPDGSSVVLPVAIRGHFRY